MKNSFEVVYEEQKQSIYAYLYYMTKDQSIAEDLCQETFLKIYLNLKKFKEQSSIKTWCMVIARNTFLTWVKKKQITTVQISEDNLLNNHYENNPEHKVILEEKKDFIKNTLLRLKEEYRTVLILRDYEGLSYKDIGIITGFTETKVKITIYRAREQYKKLYQEKGGEGDGM